MSNIIFNKDNNGPQELKGILGYFDAQYNFDNLVSDIELETPYLINFIGQDAYELALYEYNPAIQPSGYTHPSLDAGQTAKLAIIIKLIQTYILTMSVLNHMKSGDLEHTTAGRKQNKTENQSTPWEWQIQADNAAHLKRAYKALDHLFVELDALAHSTWTDSKNYLTARGLYVYSTQILDDIFPIGDSGQLYHRVTTYMRDYELECIFPIIGKDKDEQLRDIILDDDEQSLVKDDEILLSHIRKAVVFLAMSDAYQMLPVEMFPDQVNYNENTTMKSKARAEKVQSLKEKAQLHLRNVEQQFAKLSTTTETIARDPHYGLQDQTNHVSL